MSDTCYMEVMCLRQHQYRFIALGFHLDSETGNVAIMVDDDANYAHFGKLPTDIPYTAFHSYGGDYGPHLIACDGKRHVEVPGDRDGFVIVWNYEDNEPGPGSVAKIREYLEIKALAQDLLDDDSE